MISESNADMIKSPQLDRVKIGGHTKQIMDQFFHNRIFSEFAQNVAYKEAEDAFRYCIDDEYPSGGIWQGEYWGKTMLSACEAYRYTHDAQLLQFIHKSAQTLLTFQREDGYIGTYRDSSNYFAIPKDDPNGPEGPYRGWNWNIWCRKYTLWGLLECFDVTGDEKLLAAANRHALQLLDELQRNGTDIADTGTFVGLPSCSIMKPILLLYQHTGNPKLLDFAISIADNWERADNKCPNLIVNALSGKRLTQWYPNTEKWAKAYEMMSCFEGIIELYRCTGREKYLLAAEAFYEILVEHELNPVFSVGYNDIFADAAYEINAITEPCDAIHFMRICYELYLIRGNVKYMDSFEKTFFNAFLAGIFNDGKWGARGVRGAGRHFWVTEQAKFVYNHCCVNNMPRAFATMARCAVVSRNGQIMINLYENGEFDLQQGKIKIAGSYFTDGNVRISAELRDGCSAVMLRIPDWCDGADITVHGKSHHAHKGYFSVNGLAGAEEIRIRFALVPKFHKFSREIPLHTQEDWKKRRFLLATSVSPVPEEIFLETPRLMLTYGPLLMARSKLIGNNRKEIFASLTNATCVHAEVLPSYDVRTKVKLTFEDGSETVVCDYASAGNEKLIDPLFFSIYY